MMRQAKEKINRSVQGKDNVLQTNYSSGRIMRRTFYGTSIKKGRITGRTRKQIKIKMSLSRREI